jgi:asparaginyl-tRNA synthetase
MSISTHLPPRHYPHHQPHLPGDLSHRNWRTSAHIAGVKAAMLRAAQDLLDTEGFTQVFPPVLTSLSGACGEPGTLIPVELHGRRAYLRQTSQLYLEPLMRELGKVYSISRSFRAERHSDERHLTEFTLLEAEVAGYGLQQLMALMERLVCEMLHRAGVLARQHLKALGVDPAKLESVQPPFVRITYDDAIIALQAQGYFVEWGEDLSEEHELALTRMVGGPLLVTRYPVELRFFTMKICRDDPRVVECCDLLMPGVGEVMGASETETDPGLLETKLMSSKGVRQLLDLGVNPDDYGWYIQMHRQAGTRQAGFGMGFERLVRYACGLRSVADAVV